ncbi:MAG: hypothetical protein V3W41_22535 [Planctomycetota bacterium]
MERGRRALQRLTGGNCNTVSVFIAVADADRSGANTAALAAASDLSEATVRGGIIILKSRGLVEGIAIGIRSRVWVLTRHGRASIVALVTALQ